MNSYCNYRLRLVALWVFSFVFLGIIGSGCFATEQPLVKRHSLADAISIILKGQLLKENDLSNLSLSELQIARNAVYARHGRPFNSYGIGFYFSRRSWYYSDKGFAEGRLTANDHKNVARIQKAEHGSLPRPDNRTVEGAMRLYLDAFFWADSNAYLALCHPKHPPRFTAYEIGAMKRLESRAMQRKELEQDFARKGDQWTEFFGDLGGIAQYRWLILGTTLDDWNQDGETFRLPSRDDPNPKAKKAIYVRWQKIEGRYYIAEFSDILC